MSLTPEDLDRLRELGRQRRRPRRVEVMRARLAPYIDTGLLTDDEVRQAFAAFDAAENEPIETVN